jgi:hypothetical protein
MRALSNKERLILKAVASEEFPERGWVVTVVPCANGGQRVVGVYTRGQLYQQVNMLFDECGAEYVREQAKRKMPRRYDIHFVDRRHAGDEIDAGRLVSDAIAKQA